MNGADRRVEGVVYERLRGGAGGVLADDEGDAAVGVNVVGAVLGVVFDYEDGSVVPVRAVGDGLDHASHGQIVIGN